VPGNYRDDEEINAGIGEEADLTSANTVRFQILGTEGPNRGRMEVFIDGVSQGIININNSAWLQGASLFQSAVLPEGTHTLRIVNTSDNVSTSQNGIDEIIVSKYQ
jgi:hypothetical protein